MFVGQGHALAGDLAVPDHIARQGDKWYEYGPQIHRICDGGGQPAALQKGMEMFMITVKVFGDPIPTGAVTATVPQRDRVEHLQVSVAEKTILSPSKTTLVADVRDIRFNNVHAKSLSEIHTYKLSEGAVFKRLNHLAKRKFLLALGNFNSFLNKDSAQNYRKCKENTEADSDYEIKGCNGDFSTIIRINNERWKKGANRGAYGRNNQSKHVCSVALLADIAYFCGHTAI